MVTAQVVDCGAGSGEPCDRSIDVNFLPPAWKNRWAQVNEGQPIRIYYDASTEPTSLDCEPMFIAAIAQWNSVAKRTIFEYATDQANSYVTADFRDVNSTTTLAFTFLPPLNGLNVQDPFLLVINEEFENFYQMNPTEKQAVIAHELGHILGLEHTLFDNGLMTAALNGDNTLSQILIDEACVRYPAADIQKAAVMTLQLDENGRIYFDAQANPSSGATTQTFTLELKTAGGGSLGTIDLMSDASRFVSLSTFGGQVVEFCFSMTDSCDGTVFEERCSVTIKDWVEPMVIVPNAIIHTIDPGEVFRFDLTDIIQSTTCPIADLEFSAQGSDVDVTFVSPTEIDVSLRQPDFASGRVNVQVRCNGEAPACSDSVFFNSSGAAAKGFEVQNAQTVACWGEPDSVDLSGMVTQADGPVTFEIATHNLPNTPTISGSTLSFDAEKPEDLPAFVVIQATCDDGTTQLTQAATLSLTRAGSKGFEFIPLQIDPAQWNAARSAYPATATALTGKPGGPGAGRPRADQGGNNMLDAAIGHLGVSGNSTGTPAGQLDIYNRGHEIPTMNAAGELMFPQDGGMHDPHGMVLVQEDNTTDASSDCFSQSSLLASQFHHTTLTMRFPNPNADYIGPESIVLQDRGDGFTGPQLGVIIDDGEFVLRQLSADANDYIRSGIMPGDGSEHEVCLTRRFSVTDGQAYTRLIIDGQLVTENTDANYANTNSIELTIGNYVAGNPGDGSVDHEIIIGPIEHWCRNPK